jgi:hypothetical protein
MITVPARQHAEVAMADDKTKRALQDAKLISLTEDYEIEYWTEALGVTREGLAEAIRAVGHSADKVRTYLEEDAVAPG